jgi:hypothetical protein
LADSFQIVPIGKFELFVPWLKSPYSHVKLLMILANNLQSSSIFKNSSNWTKMRIAILKMRRVGGIGGGHQGGLTTEQHLALISPKKKSSQIRQIFAE